jgi:toxin ParE1/3/4
MRSGLWTDSIGNSRVKELKLRDHAEFDLEESANWYDEQQSGVGEEFLAEVRLAFQRILNNSETYPVVQENVRRFVMKRFPFLIYYVATKTEVTILRVIHSSREPDEWKKQRR